MHARTRKIATVAGAGVGLATLAAIAVALTRSAPAPRGIRERLLAEIDEWVPSDLGDGRFEQLLGEPKGPGRWAYYELDARTGKGFGTTCGVFVAALLERAGGCAPELINRGDNYRIGAHISRLREGAQQVGAWRTDFSAIRPGDVFLIATPPKGTDAHVGFFVERRDGWIITADAGQPNDAKSPAGVTADQAARIVRRKHVDGGLTGPEGIGSARPLLGYVDVEAACRGSA